MRFFSLLFLMTQTTIRLSISRKVQTGLSKDVAHSNADSNALLSLVYYIFSRLSQYFTLHYVLAAFFLIVLLALLLWLCCNLLSLYFFIQLIMIQIKITIAAIWTLTWWTLYSSLSNSMFTHIEPRKKKQSGKIFKWDTVGWLISVL